MHVLCPCTCTSTVVSRDAHDTIVALIAYHNADNPQLCEDADDEVGIADTPITVNITEPTAYYDDGGGGPDDAEDEPAFTTTEEPAFTTTEEPTAYDNDGSAIETNEEESFGNNKKLPGFVKVAVDQQPDAHNPAERGQRQCMKDCKDVKDVTLGNGDGPVPGCGAVFVGEVNSARAGECHLMLDSEVESHPRVEDLRLFVRLDQSEMLEYPVVHTAYNADGGIDTTESACEASRSSEVGNMLTVACEEAGMTQIPRPVFKTTRVAQVALVDSLSLQYNNFGVIQSPSDDDGSTNGFTAEWRNLKTLDLSYCQITGVDAQAFRHLANLNTLLLASNELTSWTLTPPPLRVAGARGGGSGGRRRRFDAFVGDAEVAAAVAVSPFCAVEQRTGTGRCQSVIKLLDISNNSLLADNIPSRYIEQLGLGGSLLTFRATSLKRLNGVALDAFRKNTLSNDDVPDVLVESKINSIGLERDRFTKCETRAISTSRYVHCDCAQRESTTFAPGYWETDDGTKHHGCWEVLNAETAITGAMQTVTKDTHRKNCANETDNKRRITFEVDLTGTKSQDITAAYVKWIVRTEKKDLLGASGDTIQITPICWEGADAFKNHLADTGDDLFKKELGCPTTDPTCDDSNNLPTNCQQVHNLTIDVGWYDTAEGYPDVRWMSFAFNEAREKVRSEFYDLNSTSLPDPCIAEAEAAAASGPKDNTVTIAGSAVGGMAALFVLIVIVVLAHRRHIANAPVKRATFDDMFATLVTSGLINPVDAFFHGENDDDGSHEGGGTNKDPEHTLPREIARSCVTMLQPIGEGNFGEVWKGILDERHHGGAPSFAIAVKKSKVEDNTEEARTDFIRESVISAQFTHSNIVGLVGVVTSGKPMLMLFELCEHGSLSSFLKDRAQRAGSETGQEWALSLDHRTSICHQTAMGLDYLSSKRFIHRDVAARNVLVSATYEFKISDFGLGREMAGGEDEAYYRSERGGAMPVRWCAPEVLTESKYSEATDVWAWGILVSEVFNDGLLPYKGIQNAEVWTKVADGSLCPSCPASCPQELWELIAVPTYAKSPIDRPTFSELVGIFFKMGQTMGPGNAPATAPRAHRSSTFWTPSGIATGSGGGSPEPQAASHYEYAAAASSNAIGRKVGINNKQYEGNTNENAYTSFDAEFAADAAAKAEAEAGSKSGAGGATAAVGGEAEVEGFGEAEEEEEEEEGDNNTDTDNAYLEPVVMNPAFDGGGNAP